MSTPYDEYGGRRDHPQSYSGVIGRQCPDCKAEVGEVCTFMPEVLVNGQLTKVKTNRHHPCIARTKSSEA